VDDGTEDPDRLDPELATEAVELRSVVAEGHRRPDLSAAMRRVDRTSWPPRSGECSDSISTTSLSLTPARAAPDDAGAFFVSAVVRSELRPQLGE